MRSRKPLAPRPLAGRDRRPSARAARLALCLALACQSFLPPAAAQTLKRRGSPAQSEAKLSALSAQAKGTKVSSVRVVPAGTAKVNVKKLAAQFAKARKGAAPAVQEIHPPVSVREQDLPDASRPAQVSQPSWSQPGELQAEGPVAEFASSPSPSSSFLAQEDSPRVGTATFVIPPGTMGAVGPNKLFVNLNNNYRVQDKATGVPLSTVSIETFWASTGGAGVFDPRVQYDPYNNRWLVAAASNAQTANSSILFGVSQTSDPQGTFNLYRVVVGCASGAGGCNGGLGEWADFPMLGFNKNWLAVSWNAVATTTGEFLGGKVLAVDYTQLLAASPAPASTVFTGAAIGFCNHPATTLSATENTLYLVKHVSSAAALYAVSTLTGTPSAPSLTVGPNKLRDVHGQGTWLQPGGDILPQQCVGAVPTQCPAAPRPIETQDSFVRSNVVFRSGRIYYPQTVGLDNTPGAPDTIDRTAAQWTVLDAATGDDVDGGRVEDATATATNGGHWYAYPSIAVNKNGDLMLGFSEFESDDFADAAYAFRQASDAPGTMRDPVTFKEGEDYYEKTLTSTRNRWGDYSHTVVDPSNDADMWTIQEYAATRVPASGLGPTDSRWGTWWAKISMTANPGDLVISEIRWRGPGGASDEFVEIYNDSGAALTVQSVDNSSGFAVAASDGVVRFVIPNGTVIPARGHFLGCNSAGYSLAAYPAGPGATATCDAAYTNDIPEPDPDGAGALPRYQAGVALFRTSTPAAFTLANRLDAVGSVGEPNTLYKEGAGLPNVTLLTTDHSFFRDMCGKGGNIATGGGCTLGGFPKDTDNNTADFVFADVEGTPTAAGERLGAPGPENLSSPVQRNSTVSLLLLDRSLGASSPPNRARDFASDPANNSTFGTLTVRRRVVNNTGQTITRLRFRVVDITTYPTPAGFAQLRVRSISSSTVGPIGDADTCFPVANPCTVTAHGTTLETPPAQPFGGGFNSSLSAGTVTVTPVPPGGSINVQFLLGLESTGVFRFFINVEALP